VIMGERGGVLQLAMMGVALVGLALAGVLAVTAYENPERVERARAKVREWLDDLRASRDGIEPTPPLVPDLDDLPPSPEEPLLPPPAPLVPEAPPLAPSASPGEFAGSPAPEAPRAPEGLSPPELPLPPGVPAVASAQHVVQSGDTLYRIAEQYYDDPGKWPLIAKANDIRSPKHLRVGIRIVIPGL